MSELRVVLDMHLLH